MYVERVTSGIEPPKTPLGQLLAETHKVDPAHFTAEFMSLTHFKPLGKPWRIVQDIFGVLRRRKDGSFENYLQTFEKAAKQTGRRAAAQYGDARIGDEDIVLFAMDWNFIRGSFGELEGREFVDGAIKHAIYKKRKLVALVPSGGARQQESVASLMQIPRMVYALQELKRKTAEAGVLYIPVHMGTFGGLSVSIAYGDLTIGVKGMSSGFAGPGLMSTYEGVPPRQEDQSVELHCMNGLIDYLVSSPRELYDYLDKIFKHARNNAKNREEDRKLLRPLMDQVVRRRRIAETHGFVGLLNADPSAERVEDIVDAQPKLVHEVSLSDWVQQLSLGHRRIDMVDILEHGVDDPVALCMRWRLPGSNMLEAPDIGAGLGRIGRESFVWIGNIHKYYQVGNGEVRKIPSAPERQDAELLKRYSRFAELLGLSCIFLCSTPGSPANRKAEREGIAIGLYQGIDAGLKFKGRLQTIILGILGSGGGLLTAPYGDRFSILERAVMCVASPKFSTEILLGKDVKPTREDVELTARNSRITARDLLDMGVVDDIIAEPMGGAEVNPTRMIESIRDHIFQVSVELNRKSLGQVLRERGKRLLGLRIMHIEPVEES